MDLERIEYIEKIFCNESKKETKLVKEQIRIALELLTGFQSLTKDGKKEFIETLTFLSKQKDEIKLFKLDMD